MSRIEIRLEEGSLDLLPDAEKEWYATKQIHDLRDLETRKGGVSRIMVIPRTQNNVEILGVQLVEFGRDTPIDYSFLDCEVFMSAYPVVSDAKLIVVNEFETSKTISIQIFGGVVDFFDQLSGDSIRLLNWAEFSFEWTLDNIEPFVNVDEGFLFANNVWSHNDNWDQAISEGYDPDNDLYLNAADINYNGAWMYVKTIVDKILATMPNLKFDFSKLEAVDLYDKMVLAMPVYQLLNNFTDTTGIEGFREADELNTGNIPPATAFNLDFPIEKADQPAGLWNVGTNEYLVTESGFYNITLDLHTSSPSTQGSTNTVVRVMVASDVVYSGPSGNINFPVDHFFEASIFANEGQSIRVEWFVSSFATLPQLLNYDGLFKISSTVSAGSRFVDISDWIPDISQRDFIKEIFKPFHALPIFENGVTVIALWDDIPKAEQFDLTPFADVSREITKQGYIPGYGQINVFEYSVDSGIARIGTDFLFNMRNDILPERATKIKSIFSPSDQAQSIDFLKLSTPSHPFEFKFETGNRMSVMAGSDTFTTEEQNTLKIGDMLFVRNNANTVYQPRRRVIAINGKNGVVDVNWNETSNMDFQTTTYSKTTILNRIGFVFQEGESFFRDGGINRTVDAMKGVTFPDSYTWKDLADQFYPSLIAMLEKPVVKRVWFRLPTTVFNALTPLTPVYFKDRSYYLNIIEQYNFSRFCRIELVEIKATERVTAHAFYIVIPNPVNWGGVEQSTVTRETVDIINTGNVPIRFQLSEITGPDASFFDHTAIPAGLNFTAFWEDYLFIPQSEKVYLVAPVDDWAYGCRFNVPLVAPSVNQNLLGYSRQNAGPTRWFTYITSAGELIALSESNYVTYPTFFADFAGQTVDIRAQWVGANLELYVNDVLRASLPAARPDAPIVNQDFFIAAWGAVNGDTGPLVDRYLDGRIRSFFVDTDIWDLQEGSGFDVVSDTGVTAQGVTSNVGQLTYWNAEVWRFENTVIVGDGLSYLEVNEDYQIIAQADKTFIVPPTGDWGFGFTIDVPSVVGTASHDFGYSTEPAISSRLHMHISGTGTFRVRWGLTGVLDLDDFIVNFGGATHKVECRFIGTDMHILVDDVSQISAPQVLRPTAPVPGQLWWINQRGLVNGATQDPARYRDGIFRSWFVDVDIWGLKEGVGQNVSSNTGVTSFGFTIEISQLQYWNASVWQTIIDGGTTFTLQPNGVQEIDIDFTADTSFGPRTAEFTVQAIDPDIFDVVTVLNAFINSPANYSVTPSLINFGNVEEGHQEDLFTRVQNTGTEPIDFTLGAFFGDNPGEFGYHPGQSLAFTLNPGEFEDVDIRWNSELILGLKQADFTIQAISPDIFDTIVHVNGTTTI